MRRKIESVMKKTWYLLAFVFAAFAMSACNGQKAEEGAGPADKILLKDFAPVVVNNLPVTYVERAKFDIIDMHAHDYASSEEEIAQWCKTMDEVGVLNTLADEMNTRIHEPVLMTSIIGALSSIVDNVPLVSACIKMFEGMAPAGTVDPYLLTFVEDGLFWHLLTFCAGVGGSLLIIGSAAGVVAMGIEKIPFFWYVKKISLLALAGYVAGIIIICLESMLPFFMQVGG